MTYARLSNGAIAEYPLYEGEIKLRFPNTSFAQPFVPPSDYVAVATSPQPPVAWDKNISEADPEIVDGVWTQQWLIEDATAEQITQRTESQASSIRAERNGRLAACDWTQVPDAYNAGVDMAAWAAYRQELRDVPDQPGFPWDVSWPVEPQASIQGVLCDYRSFYDALLVSPAYAVIRTKAIADSAVLTACVEFIAAIGDAKAGRPNPPAIQACVDLLCAAAQFTENELTALGEVMAIGGLDQLYTLPS